jgi:hypothetical protein
MKRRTIRILKYACLTIFVLIGIDVIIFGIKHGPPPVPLDPEGHMAPYYETPGWAF